MPKKSPKTKAGKSKPVRRGMDAILKIMEDVAAARAGGMSLAKALEQVGVHYNTFLSWTKKYGKPSPGKPAKSAARQTRRSPEEVIQVMGEINALRAAGKTIAQALSDLGVNPFTYRYWRKKFGAVGKGTVSAPGKTSAAKTGRLDVVTILEQMTENRKKRKELEEAEKQIRELDIRFEELRGKLFQ